LPADMRCSTYSVCELHVLDALDMMMTARMFWRSGRSSRVSTGCNRKASDAACLDA
jgi:hypothetical protein